MRFDSLRNCLPFALAALVAACAQPQPGNQIVTVDVPGPWDFANYGEGQVAIGEIALVSRQVLGCWSPPEGLEEKSAPDFVIRAQIDRQALVTASELRSPEQGMQEPQSLAVIKSAQEALANCGPLHLPADKYESWQQLDFRFSARSLPLVGSWRRTAAPAVAVGDADPGLSDERPPASSRPLTASERLVADKVRERIVSCWHPPFDIPNAEDMVVELRLNLDPDGSVRSVDVLGRGKPRNTDFRRSAEAALRAVKRCSPLPLPADSYDSWRTIVLHFDPSHLFEQ